MEAHDDIAEILKTTPSELAYNRALERSGDIHKRSGRFLIPYHQSAAIMLCTKCWTGTDSLGPARRSGDNA